MFLQVIRYGFAVLVLAFLIGLLTLNYSALAALILGAVISWPVVRLLRFIVTNWGRISLPVIIALGLVGCILYVLFLLPLFLTPNPFPPLINGYHLTINNPNWESGVFSIKETVFINPQWVEYYHETDLPPSVDLPEREVTSTKIGLLTREVRIIPVQADPTGGVAITLPDGSTLKGTVCSFSCGPINIEIHDAPKGSFLSARDSDKIQKVSSVDTEAVSWSVFSLEGGITFAFVPPPFNYMGPIIEPLAGVSALNQVVLGILGLISTLLITPILKPVILAAAQKSFGPWLDKRSGAKAR